MCLPQDVLQVSALQAGPQVGGLGILENQLSPGGDSSNQCSRWKQAIFSLKHL